MTTTWLQRGAAALAAIGILSAPAIGPLLAATPNVDSLASGGLETAARQQTSFTYCGEKDPARLGYDPFYVHQCEAQGMDVIASDAVDPFAVQRAAEIAIAMIGHRQDLVDVMVEQRVRVGVIARDEVTSDMPEYRDIYEMFPGVDWDARARGLGATATIPLSSVGEENILCLPGDTYVGSSIMVHEFAHTILDMGLRRIDPAYTDPRANDPVVAAYIHAQSTGLWQNTYAISNPVEYWAEAVMSYFDTNIDGPVGGDGIHNQIDTRAELASYDPQIYAVIDEVFGDAAPLELCNG